MKRTRQKDKRCNCGFTARQRGFCVNCIKSVMRKYRDYYVFGFWAERVLDAI